MIHDTNFWKDLCQDMVEVLGNDPYMVATAMKGWIKKMADTEDERRLLDLVNDIENRLLSVKSHEWNE